MGWLVPVITVIVSLVAVAVAWLNARHAVRSAVAAEKSAKVAERSAAAAERSAVAAEKSAEADQRIARATEQAVGNETRPSLRFSAERVPSMNHAECVMVYSREGKPPAVVRAISFGGEKPQVLRHADLFPSSGWGHPIPKAALQKARAKPQGQQVVRGYLDVEDSANITWRFNFEYDVGNMSVAVQAPIRVKSGPEAKAPASD